MGIPSFYRWLRSKYPRMVTVMKQGPVFEFPPELEVAAEATPDKSAPKAGETPDGEGTAPPPAADAAAASDSGSTDSDLDDLFSAMTLGADDIGYAPDPTPVKPTHKPMSFREQKEREFGSSQPREVDTLLLDLNGVVHRAAFPEGQDGVDMSFEAAFCRVESYIEQIMDLLPPQQVLFLAIDGVAPRAKMDQQRKRRFMAAKTRGLLADVEERLRQEWKDAGVDAPEVAKAAFDRNLISPGTPFMMALGDHMRNWIAQRLATAPAWKHLTVIFSDSSVPGEGEHKLVQWIRDLRSYEGYDPNWRHAIYGLDADLFMLSLGTHEPRFYVIREKMTSKKACHLCLKMHATRACPLKAYVRRAGQAWELLNIALWRDYLDHELHVETSKLGFRFEFDRAVDDLIFMSFLVGNDFLPHLPTLDIAEGALDHLLTLYKKMLPELGGYLTDHGKLHFGRLATLLTPLSDEEQRVFHYRWKQSKYRKSGPGGGGGGGGGGGKKPPYAVRPVKPQYTAGTPLDAELAGKISTQVGFYFSLGNLASDKFINSKLAECGNWFPVEVLLTFAKLRALIQDSPTLVELLVKNADLEFNADKTALRRRGYTPPGYSPPPPAADDTAADADDDAATDSDDSDAESSASSSAAASSGAGGGLYTDSEFRKRLAQANDELQSAPADSAGAHALRLWEPQYKERYYRAKFFKDAAAPPADADIDAKRLAVADGYLRGLQWVAEYYYNGCISWKWIYEFHYAPMASDLAEACALRSARGETADGEPFVWEPTEPFTPLLQLFTILPASSAELCIPAALVDVMTDPKSALADLFPSDIEVDFNGARWVWQATVLLPFVDEERILATILPIVDTLPEAKERCFLNHDAELWVAEAHPLSASIAAAAAAGDARPLEVTGHTRGLVFSAVSPATTAAIQKLQETPPATAGETPAVAVGAVHACGWRTTQLHPHDSALKAGVLPNDESLTRGDLSHLSGGDRYGKWRIPNKIKDKVCVSFVNAVCRYGAECSYLHDLTAIEPKRVCLRFFSAGKCGDRRCKSFHLSADDCKTHKVDAEAVAQRIAERDAPKEADADKLAPEEAAAGGPSPSPAPVDVAAAAAAPTADADAETPPAASSEPAADS